MYRACSDQIVLKLKLAIADTFKNCTLGTVASQSRVTCGRLSEYANINNSMLPPLDVAVDMVAASGNDALLRTFADVLGYDIVPKKSDASKSGDILHDVAAAMKEFGEATKATGDLINRPSINACKEALREVNEAEAGIEHLRHGLESELGALLKPAVAR